MCALVLPSAVSETREQRIEAIMQQIRPKMEATVRQLVERAVDVPKAEEFGAIDFEFRDAGQKLANDVRQASVASRKKRLHGVQRDLSGLRLCSEISFLSATSAPDGSRRNQG